MALATGRCLAAASVLLAGTWPASGHGWTSMRNEDGEEIESRNSLAWKLGAQYPNPQAMSTTNSSTRPFYCGGLGQTGYSRPEHDLISAPEALQRAKAAGFATKLRKGSKFTLRNFLTANHGGVAALWYSCPAGSVDTPEEYTALDWKILTPSKESYPESKRNGVAFSDKMPEWYGFAGGICNPGAGYTGGVIQTCDDCQLRYGGPETTAAWQAEKPPSGAALGTGQLATIVEVEYQLPAGFECPTAVFSWMWHTPHLCMPKEVAEKRAENDFWKFCNRDLEGAWACQREWQGEIFTNCMDAEVAAEEGAAPSPPVATLVATARPTPVPAQAPTPVKGCATCSSCVANVPNEYGQAATDELCAPCGRGGQTFWPCDLADLCKCGGGGAPGPTPPEEAAPTPPTPASPPSAPASPTPATDASTPSPPAATLVATARPTPAPSAPVSPTPSTDASAPSCVPVGECSPEWCEQAKLAAWCSGQGAGCPAPFCKAAAPSPAPVPAAGGCSADWVQCGGSTWTGARCCQAGSHCSPQGEYYSQCRPGDAASLALVSASRRQKFLGVVGAALLQTEAGLQRGTASLEEASEEL